ncbi:MAG TPA: YtxH domain-containing protein [Acidimicrobiales bacterium]|nr:YtxH domain-containing protein [Acidimicrobiales bacterium]
MRFRLGLLVGFGSGYYLGCRAGRERYEQINHTIAKIKRSDAYETATEKVHEAVDTGVAKAKEAVDSARDNGDDPVAATTPGGSEFLPPPMGPLP